MSTLRIRERVAICVAILPMMVLGMGLVNADGDCPSTKSKKDACKSTGGADCDTYMFKSECEGKTSTTIYVDFFQCESDGTKSKSCVPETSGSEAVKRDCTKEYKCIWVDATKCGQGDQVGNTLQGVVYLTKDCPKGNPE